MNKLSLALLTSAAVTSMAFADAAAPSATGFYVGLNAGVANTNVKVERANNMDSAILTRTSGDFDFNSDGAVGRTVAQTGAAKGAKGDGKYYAKDVTYDLEDSGKNDGAFEQFQFNHNFDGGKANPIVSLMLGYNHQIDQFVIGVDGTLGYDFAKVASVYTQDEGSKYGLNIKTESKRNLFYGLSLRFGYLITPSTLMFLKAGIEAGKWKNTSDLSSMETYAVDTGMLNKARQTDESIAATKADEVKASDKNKIGFVAGLGLDVFLNKNMFVRIEGSHYFGSSSKVQQSVEAKAFASTGLGTNFKPSQTRFQIGVAYKF